MIDIKQLSIASSAVLLLACSSGGGGGSDDDSATGLLSLGVTDGPVEGVSEIWVEFDGLTLKPANGPQQEYLFDPPKSIDLKSLTNGKIELLFEQAIAAGSYNWMKLHVNADFDSNMDSYVVENGGGQIELRVPPDRLKLGNHFTITQGGATSLVIEWNLRMGLTNPIGQPGYKLQPSLRITDLTEHGAVSGAVETDLLPVPCTSDPGTGEGNVVYVYQGFDVVPDDIDGIPAEPITTADIRLDPDSGDQSYSVPYLSPGNYTVAFTCQGSDDVIPDPDNAAIDPNDSIVFSAGSNVTVSDDEVTELNFPVD
jgi:hypothetical protein